MSNLEKVGDLQINQDMDFQEKEWKVERIGWVIGLVLLLAALAGLFGPGPLSSRTVQNGALEVQWDRFTRFQSPSTISVRIQPAHFQDGTARLWVDRDFLDHYEVRKIVPEPEAAQLLPGQVVYDFQAEPGDAPLLVRFFLESDRVGPARGEFGAGEAGNGLEIRQFIYP